ncbi:MAG: efflux RND transporter periplasmic adaptor subunit [Gammaproteobacteria bacterium]
MSTIPRKMRQAAAPLIVLAVGIAIAAWFVTSRPRAHAKPPEEKVWPVAVIEVAAADVQPAVTVFGEVRAAREAELRALVAGRLVELDGEFRNGNLVEAGRTLAVIDPVDYENRLVEARAELARNEALLVRQRHDLEWEGQLADNAARQVELARRTLERTAQLAKSGRESQKARDDAEAALAVSEQTQLQRRQNVARLEAQVREQKAATDKAQAALASAERELVHTRVVAPFTGHVTDVRLALGQRIAVGEKLGRLLSAAELEVRFELPEAAYARLTAAGERLVGRPLTLRWRLGDETREFAATLARVGAEIDPTLGGIALYATLPDDAPRQGLRAGAFVEVDVPDVAYHDVVRLPARALSEDGEVFALVDGRLERVAVAVVRELGEEILVRGELDPARPVVARSFPGIGPGMRARPL